MLESEVIRKVEVWLKKRGYVTKREVRLFYREADIVGYKSPNKFIAIEAKGEVGVVISGVGQAISYGVAVDESYLAIEPKMLKEIGRFIDKIPIGILLVNKHKVRLYKKSIEFNPSIEWKMYLIELFEKGKAKRPIEEGPYGPQPEDTPEMKRLKRLLTTESLWFWVLLLLSKRPYHAYILRDKIKNEFGFTPGTVTAYKVLYLLERGKYVTKIRKGNKIFYKITRVGKEQINMARKYLSKVERL